ncbi:MAG: DUF2955 domain-containing protein [Allosphingosinicella sp.]
MAQVRPAGEMTSDRFPLARLHSLLRFSTGVTLALVISEAMGWQPTFLPPVLTVVLLANLPVAPPLKTGLALVIVMTAAALVAFMLPSLLNGSPQILVGAIGVIVFLAFATMAQGRAALPATFLLLCISTVPVVAMIYPAQASILPIALVRGITVAVLVVWCMFALWPKVAPRQAPPAGGPIESPVRRALVGTAIVMPVMLVYLLFGLADALPVLVTTVLLVVNFDPKRGAVAGLGMMLGNLAGGLIGVVLYLLLQIAPSLVTLALLAFVAAMAFAVRIDRGGPGGAVAVIACNTSLIILTSAMASGPTSSGLWITRLAQFALACAFAIGMMILVWGRNDRPSRSPT